MSGYKKMIAVGLLMMFSCKRYSAATVFDQGGDAPGPVPGATVSANPNFRLYNAIHYVNTPDLGSYGVHAVNLFYETFLTKADATDAAGTAPDPVKISAVATSSAADPSVPVTLDIEDWPFDQQTREKSLAKYLTVVNTFKSFNPKSKIGYYNTVPKPIYEWSKVSPAGSAAYASWQSTNDYIKPLADRIDIFFPGLYTYDTDTEAWKNAALATISEIKRYNEGKPIIAYLYPQYHPNTALALQFIPASVWREELEFAYAHTDGVVIWTSNKDPQGNKISWDANMPWWKATQDFIAAHNIR